MDPRFRYLDPLDALEAEQELDPVDGRVGGNLLQDGPQGLLHVLAERDALDDQARQVDRHPLVRLEHEPSPSRPPVTSRYTQGIRYRQTIQGVDASRSTAAPPQGIISARPSARSARRS